MSIYWRINQSSKQDFDSCTMLFYFRHILGLRLKKQEIYEAMKTGSEIHELMEGFKPEKFVKDYTNIYNKQPTQEQIKMAENKWSSMFSIKSIAASRYIKEKYQSYIDKVVYEERNVFKPFPDKDFKDAYWIAEGKIDAETKDEIIDYKTSKIPKTKSDWDKFFEKENIKPQSLWYQWILQKPMLYIGLNPLGISQNKGETEQAFYERHYATWDNPAENEQFHAIKKYDILPEQEISNKFMLFQAKLSFIDSISGWDCDGYSNCDKYGKCDFYDLCHGKNESLYYQDDKFKRKLENVQIPAGNNTGDFFHDSLIDLERDSTLCIIAKEMSVKENIEPNIEQQKEDNIQSLETIKPVEGTIKEMQDNLVETFDIIAILQKKGDLDEDEKIFLQKAYYYLLDNKTKITPALQKFVKLHCKVIEPIINNKNDLKELITYGFSKTFQGKVNIREIVEAEKYYIAPNIITDIEGKNIAVKKGYGNFIQNAPKVLGITLLQYILRLVTIKLNDTGETNNDSSNAV